MHVNTDAVRTYGAGGITRAADIADVANAVSAMDSRPLADVFGLVGVRFAQALAHATAALGRDLNALAGHLGSAASASAAAARAFDGADDAARYRIDRIGL